MSAADAEAVGDMTDGSEVDVRAPNVTLPPELAAALPYIRADLLRSKAAPATWDGGFDKRLTDEIRRVASEVAASSGIEAIVDGEPLGDVIVGEFMVEVFGLVVAVMPDLVRLNGRGAELVDLSLLSPAELFGRARDAGKEKDFDTEIRLREEFLKFRGLWMGDVLTNYTFLSAAYRVRNRLEDAMRIEEARLKFAEECQDDESFGDREKKRIKSEIFLSKRSMIILRDFLRMPEEGDQQRMIELCRDMVVQFDSSDLDRVAALDGMAISHKKNGEYSYAAHAYRALYALRVSMDRPLRELEVLLGQLKALEKRAGIPLAQTMHLAAGELPTAKLIGWALDARADQDAEAVIVLQGEILKRAKAEGDNVAVCNAYLVASLAYEARWNRNSAVDLDRAKEDLDRALYLTNKLLEYQRAYKIDSSRTSQRISKLADIGRMAFGTKGF